MDSHTLDWKHIYLMTDGLEFGEIQETTSQMNGNRFG